MYLSAIYLCTAVNIQHAWWDYGYQKEKIFFWIAWLVLVFTLVNSILFRYMNEKVYKIENVYSTWVPSNSKSSNTKQIEVKSAGLKIVSAFNDFFASFFYTSLIFFGLRLNVDKINFSNPLGVFYLFIQYALGLICLAYLTNFIIG